MSNNTGKSSTQSFLRDTQGSTGLMFALLLLPVCFMMGLAVDYSRMLQAKRGLQAAADAAALTAVKSVSAGLSTTVGAQNALANWKANAGSSIPSGATLVTPTISVATLNDVTIATVSCTQNINGTFASLMGVKTIPVGCGATAQSYPQSIINAGFNGSAWTWGDPHIVGATGADYEINDCNAGNWYNLLSDAGIEVNVACQPWAGNGVAVVTAFSVMVGSHTATLTFTQPSITAAGTGTWYSYKPVFSFDGVSQATVPATPTTYLHATGATVTYGYQKLNDTFQGINVSMPVMTVTTGQYTLTMAFPYGGYISVLASKAGICGAPDGFLGATYAGNNSPSAKGFLVSGPTATVPGFYATGCTSADLGPRLIK